MAIKARSLTIPPPTMGINVKDNITQMDPGYCVDANWFSSHGATVDLIKGPTYFSNVTGGVSGSTTHVDSLCSLALQNGGKKLVGIPSLLGAPVLNLSSGGAVNVSASLGDSASAISDGTYPAMVPFRNRLFIKSGDSQGDVYYWDGAAGTITAAGFTGPGGDDKALFSPQPYKHRLYFLGNDASIWYGGVDAITGALTQFDFQSNLNKGGKLYFGGAAMRTGDPQQYFVAITDQGEVLLYQGDYPGSTTWMLVGHYYIPPPIGRRSFFYWGNNLVIMTWQGILLLSDVMGGEANLRFISENVTNLISTTFSSGIASSAASLLTTGIWDYSNNFLIFNFYTDSGSSLSSYQLLFSTINGSWWRFSLADTVYSMCMHNGAPYAGHLKYGVVRKLFDSYTDYTFASGSEVATSRTISLRPSYNFFGNRESVKQFVEAQPTVYQSEGLTLTLDADVDFANTTATSAVADTTDTAYKLYQPKMGLKGIGNAASIRIDGTVTTKRMSLQAIKVLWNEGDIR